MSLGVIMKSLDEKFKSFKIALSFKVLDQLNADMSLKKELNKFLEQIVELPENSQAHMEVLDWEYMFAHKDESMKRVTNRLNTLKFKIKQVDMLKDRVAGIKIAALAKKHDTSYSDVRIDTRYGLWTLSSWDVHYNGNKYSRVDENMLTFSKLEVDREKGVDIINEIVTAYNKYWNTI